jgi:hypothetical protein
MSFTKPVRKSSPGKNNIISRWLDLGNDVPTLKRKKRMDENKFSQWSVNGNEFVPCKKTLETLNPGAYRIEAINQYQSWIEQKIETDGLFEMPNSESEQVVHEIENFWNRKSTFKELGFSFKRGWLLWGPQGSGKTSVVKLALKKIIGRGGIAFLIGGTDPDVFSSMLSNFREIEPERPIIIVMEDIDSMIKQWGEAEILTILDGEKSIENAVFIATTNYPEDLEGRVRDRPSRFDRVVEIGKPDEACRKSYLSSIGAKLTPEQIEEWASKTKDLSIAHLKEVVVGVYAYEQTFEEALLRVKNMKKLFLESKT